MMIRSRNMSRLRSVGARVPCSTHANEISHLAVCLFVARRLLEERCSQQPTVCSGERRRNASRSQTIHVRRTLNEDE